MGYVNREKTKKKKRRVDEARETGNDADGINARRKKEFGGHGARG